MTGAVAVLLVLGNLGLGCPDGDSLDALLATTGAIRGWMDGSTRDDVEAAEHQTEIAVISDLDDTVYELFSAPPDPALRSAFYWKAEADQLGDVHYLTGRPSMFNGNFAARLDADGMPRGPVEYGSLRRLIAFGFGGIQKEKIADIERKLLLYPSQRFVLVGDDRDRDPEVYREIQDRHPGRIAAVLIRRAGGAPRDETAYPGHYFFNEFGQARLHLAEAL